LSLYSPVLPEQRRPRLALALREGRLVRALECHNPISAMLVAGASVATGGGELRFDALWASGFAHATAMGLPDAELALLERRIDTMADIAAATSLPIIADADTGGDELAFTYLCRRLEAFGVSAVIVEDKAGAKRTSLAAGVTHEMEDPHELVKKIASARARVVSADFLIFARIESLIAGRGIEDALMRAEIYLGSPADGIVIHSKDKTAADIFAFMDGYRAIQQRVGVRKPLVLIPTAYSHIKGAELEARGAQLVIHGNHMVRAAYRSMREAAASILANDRSLEADSICAPVSELFAAVGVDVGRK
jgi:phosphoenolpyruvate phosphomutase